MNRQKHLALYFALAIHLLFLVGSASSYLAGGKPAVTGAQEVVINLAVPAAPAAKPQAKPQPKPEPKPKAKPKPKPKAAPQPEPEPEPEQEQEPELEQEDIVEEDVAVEEDNSNQAIGEQGRAGDIGEGADMQGAADTVRNRYLASVRALIEKKKRYPRRALLRRQEGTVLAHFSVLADGRVENAALSRPSGSDILDNATLQLIKRIRFAPLPQELGDQPLNISIPVNYHLPNG